MDAPTGPYLIQACLCEKVINEVDGVVSLIRIVDRITHGESGPNPPAQMPPVAFPLTLFLNLKPGRTKGGHQIRVRLRLPDGSTSLVGNLPISFDGGEDQGANMQMDLQGPYLLAGLYWFEIYWNRVADEALLTRVPLRLVYLRHGSGE